MTTTKPMKLPQLTLRELFLLVVIAAMGCGWWSHRVTLLREITDLSFEVELLNQQIMLWPKEPGEWIRVAIGESGEERIESGIGPPEF